LELLYFYDIKILSPKAKICQFIIKSEMSYFIDKLRQIMRTQGLTQQALAKMGHISNNTISKWLNGQTTPKVKNIEPLAKALNLTVGDLIGDFGNKENLTEADKKFIALPNNKKQLLLKILQDIEEGL
jgi:transcriptional regulator with XRE-family HTH domain